MFQRDIPQLYVASSRRDNSAPSTGRSVFGREGHSTHLLGGHNESLKEDIELPLIRRFQDAVQDLFHKGLVVKSATAGVQDQLCFLVWRQGV